MRTFFLSRDKSLEYLPSPFMYSCQTTCKTQDSFITGSAEKCSISFPVRFLIHKLFCISDEGFKIASCIALQTRHLHSIQIWRVIRWSLFLFKHLLTVLVEALLRDACNACRARCILLNLPLCLAEVGCTLQ